MNCHGEGGSKANQGWLTGAFITCPLWPHAMLTKICTALTLKKLAQFLPKQVAYPDDMQCF